MKPYEIKHIKRSNQYLILSTTYENPTEYLEEIEKEIKGYKGKVKFDLLLCNGYYNRFFDVVFDGEKFDLYTFRALVDVPNFIKQISRQYYLDSEQFWNSVILDNEAKYLVYKS